MAQRHFPKRSSVRVDQGEVAWGVTPNYNGPWLQIAQTNNEIVRQSSKSDWESEAGLGDIGNENNVRHVYSECSAINRTNEYMINNMTGDNGVLSYVGGGVHSNCTNAVRFPRWMHNSDYDIIGADRSTNKKLIKANVLTGVETVLADFSAYDSMTVGNSQGSGDTLDDRFALTIKDGNDLIIVVWSLVTGAEITRRTFANEWAILDNVTISPLGNYCIKGINNGTDYAVYRCSDLQYVHGADDAGHGVMALDSNGIDEYWVSISWSGTFRTIRKVHLGTGVDTILLGDGTSQFSNGGATGYESLAGHLGFAPLRPGYVLWSNNDPEGPYTVAWLPMDGSQAIEWLCDHNSEYGSGYWSEPQASASIDGTQVVFASDEQTLHGEINSFVVRAMASKSPDITTTEFTVAQDAANGTVVGQLAATYNGSSVTSDWRLHNSVNTAFAVSDSGVITVADSAQISSGGTQTIDVIVEGADGQTAEYATILVVENTSVPTLDPLNDLSTLIGDSGSFQLVGSDPNNLSLSYAIHGTALSWVSCSTSGTVAYDTSTLSQGTYSVSFVASNGVDTSNIVTMSFLVLESATGTEINSTIYRHLINPDNLIAGTGQHWEISTVPLGYTGVGMLEATSGFNWPPDTTPGVIGKYVVDVSALPTGNWHMYLRTYALDISTDSYNSQTGDETEIAPQFLFNRNGFAWQSFREAENAFTERLVSAADNQIVLTPREQSTGIDQIVFVAAEETALPTGDMGFIPTGNPEWPAGLNPNLPASIQVPQGESITIELEPSNPYGFELRSGSNSSVGIDTSVLVDHTVDPIRTTVTITGIDIGTGETFSIMYFDPDYIKPYVQFDMLVEVVAGAWPNSFSVTPPSQISIGKGYSKTFTYGISNLTGFNLADPVVTGTSEILVSHNSLGLVNISGVTATPVDQFTASVTLSFARSDNAADPVIVTIPVQVINVPVFPEGITALFGSLATSLIRGQEYTVPINYSNDGYFPNISFSATGDSGITVLDATSNSVTLRPDEVADSATLEYTVTNEGTGESISISTSFEVLSDTVWPAGMGANLSSPSAIPVGSTFRVYANPQNTHGFPLDEAYHWAINVGVAESLQETPEFIELLAVAEGVVTLTYIQLSMVPGNVSQQYSRTINVIEDMNVDLFFPEVGILSFYEDTSISYQFFAMGGEGEYSFSVPAGLPTGLSLTSAGLLTGEVSTLGSTDITVLVADDTNTESIVVTLDIAAAVVAEVYAKGTIKCADLVMTVELQQTNPDTVRAYQELLTKHNTLLERVTLLEEA